MNKKQCPKCEQVKPDTEFYLRPDRENKSQSYCKECNNANTLGRQRGMKNKMLEYKGGKCISCGFDGHPAAFDFHHRDPKEKEFHPSKLRNTSWDKNYDKITAELDKCDLLCKNCHAIAHAKY
ncbi:MAG TPA: hypothetical protein EYQ26_00055 [Rhodospirillales bacterium]|nr:hypothetical protein [Rhodospirillales bacterium]